MKFTRSRREPARVDVTPLIDIIFQLVLFFMVSTTFITTPGIDIDLPRSSADNFIREKHDLDLWVTTDGQVLVDRRPVDTSGLRRVLQRSAQEDPNTLVVIRADTEVSHGRVVAIMELARSVGLGRFAIATEVQEEEDER